MYQQLAQACLSRHLSLHAKGRLDAGAARRVTTWEVSSTHWRCVLAMLVSNLLHIWVAHQVGRLVTPVLLGCAVWGSQR